MGKIQRRTFLKSLSAGLACGPTLLKATVPNSRDIRIDSVQIEFKEFNYRVPIKFGGLVSSAISIVNVTCNVSSQGGKTAKGFGSMPLANVWSFPSRVLSYDATLAAMKALAERIAKLTGDYKEYGHPIELNWALEPEYLKAADEITRKQKLAEPIPKLVHSGNGKRLRRRRPRCLWQIARIELLPHIRSGVHEPRPVLLRRAGLQGRVPGKVCSQGTKAPHADVPPGFGNRSAGGLRHQAPRQRWSAGDASRMDQLQRVDAFQNQVGWRRPEMGFRPRTERRSGCYGDGEQAQGDGLGLLARLQRALPQRSVSCRFSSHGPGEVARQGSRRIQYVEQPTARDLDTHRQNVMFEAAKIKPVVIDESLTDLHALMLSREMGYTGAALKACKGQSNMMILAPVMERNKMFLCVQDLTCPGASLIQSASLAAHVPGVKAIEANSRQYVPAANKGWEKRFPGIFHITDGTMDTSHLNGLGMGAV